MTSQAAFSTLSGNDSPVEIADTSMFLSQPSTSPQSILLQELVAVLTMVRSEQMGHSMSTRAPHVREHKRMGLDQACWH